MDCRYCNGTGIIPNLNLSGTYNCTSCNGTGVHGEPVHALIAGVAFALAFFGGLAYLIF